MYADFDDSEPEDRPVRARGNNESSPARRR
jgi:hypothetical protein